MKNIESLLNISARISIIGLFIFAFYLSLKGNYMASICIWLQLIYIKLQSK